MRQVYRKELFGMFLLVVFASWAQATTQFGFDYWPIVNNPSFHEGCDVLQNANWTTENKNIVRCDLNNMRSYSTEVIRLMFRPEQCGWTIDTVNHTHSFDTNILNQVTSNLTVNSTEGFLRMCSARDIKAVVCFADWYYGQKDPNSPTGQYYWEEAGYTWATFLTDAKTWMNSIALAIKNSTYASTVIYLDYQNEWSSGNSNAMAYIQGVYDYTAANIPAAKRACGLLSPETQAADLKTDLGTRTLAAIDFHQYSGGAYTVQQRVDAVHAANAFPGITCYIGEFAADAADSSQEGTQETWEINTTNDAFTAGVANILHWRLWGPYRPDDPKAWGYDPNTPKDVVGGMCSNVLLDLYNPDMEIVTGGVPTNWASGGATGTNPVLTSVTDATSSATNTHFARVTCSNPGAGSIWLNSPTATLSVTGTRAMSANCFIRFKNLNNVHMVVKEYNSGGGLLVTHTGLASTALDTAPNGAWYSYSYNPGDTNWYWTLNSATAKVSVTINGTIRTPNILTYLEVDTVSVW